MCWALLRKMFNKTLFLCVLLISSSTYVFAAVASCNGVTDSQTHYGTINGTCYAYYCDDGIIRQLGAVKSTYCGIEQCKEGALKYNVSGDCSYDTFTCCADGSWSEANKDCPKPCEGAECCTSDQCWTGSFCQNKSTKGYNGKCYYTCSNWQCKPNSGWFCNESDRRYEKKRKQGGKWLVWGDLEYSHSKPRTTCSTKVKDYLHGGGSDALKACSIQVASMTGTPEGTTVEPAKCEVVGNCWCINYGGSILGDGNAYCSTNLYKCQVRELECTVDTVPCK